ncbi:hypothetical protein IWQ47_004109 [Aquimarina sp. EL_43]|nr:hypothetical protein [Aquimarina sp. EL_35]MBG6153015.1 hypothetical protein [Aquimarina sp. EL_32]MBG6171022.1 hypothetical protein [Aquimarina sp. EL_43]
MLNYYPIMHKILLVLQLFAAIVGFIYIFRLRNSYWKWLSIYLIFIFIQESFWTLNTYSLDSINIKYYAFIGIPIQYLFLFWLYAYKSLNNRKLFYFFSFIYLSTYLPIELYFGKINLVYSINLTAGTILLTFLVVLEFIKQIKNDNILEFTKNKMFYINVGVILFYIGTYPYFAFYDVLSKEPYIEIWNAYYLYFLVSNYVIYLLFTASFIWGKHHLK